MVMLNRLIVLIVCLSGLSACTTVSRLDSSSENRLTFVIDGRSFEDVWDAAHQSLPDDLTIVAENRLGGYIKATSEPDVATMNAGEAVGIFITLMDQAAQRYWIAVVSEPFYQPQYLSRDWHLQIARGMKTALGEPTGPAG